MIKRLSSDLRLGISLMRYTMDGKRVTIAFLVVGVVGLLNDAATRGRGYMGLYFLAVLSLYLTQTLNMHMVSGFVHSSSKKHRIFVEIPTLFLFLSNTLIYLLLVLLRIVYRNVFGELAKSAMVGLLFYGLTLILLTVYGVFAYHSTALRFLLLFAVIFLISISGGFSSSVEETGAYMRIFGTLEQTGLLDNPVLVGLAGYVPVLISVLVFYILSSLVYPWPVSERIYKQALAREKA